MKFTRICVRAIVIVGLALFLIATLNSMVELTTGPKSDVMESFELVAEAGLMLGVGLIAQAMLERK